MTGIEVAQNALVNITSYKYLYGAKGEVATSSMIEALIAAYPSHFNTDARKTAARAKAGYNCIDCSGYVCLVMGISSIGSWQLYETAPVKLELQYTNGKWKAGGAYIPYGAVVWKPGHVGIYVGNQQVAEAVSEENDLQINNISGRGFTHCLLFNLGGFSTSYSDNTNDAALTVPATVTQPGYIPWTGKIINAEEVIPYITANGTVPALAFGSLYNGMLVSVIGLNGNYYRIQNSAGRYAYVNTYYVGNVNAPAYESGYISWIGQVKGADNHVNVRTAPRTSASLHSTFPQLPNGTRVKVVAETLGSEDLRLWYKVSLSDNSSAFIRADLVGPDVIQNYTPWLGQANSTTGTVNIRRFATVNSALSALHAPLSNGDVVTVYGETMGSDGYRWFSVSINGVGVGYCRSDLITPAYENYYEEWYGYIQTGTGSGNLRQGPGTSYGLVEGSPYANGTLVHVEGEVNGTDGYVWYKLTEFDGFHRGYIRSDLVQASMYYSHWPVFAMTVTGTLNIRSGPGTNYTLSTICSSVPNGTGLTVVSQTVGTDLKIWYQVKINGEVAGYVRSDLVIAARPSAYAEWTATAASSTGVVNIRSGPSTNTAVISGYPQMNNGDHCTVYGQVEGADGRIWYKVKVMNLYYGYVRADLLSHGTTITLTHDYAKWNGKLQSGTQNVNIRADAGTNYSIVATLPNGTLVEVLGTKNGADSYVWYQVRTSGAAGYVRSDLVIHAGNTSGDAPYSELPWSGRAVAEQMIQVYKYPYTTGEDIQSVPMKTYFSISKKIFYSNGEIWYYVVAEDNVLDQNGAALCGYVKESWVKVFPKNHDCEVDNEAHDDTYPDGPVLEECSKCGKHVLFRKPARGMTNLNHLDFSNGVQQAINGINSNDQRDLLIDIDDLVVVLYDIEEAYVAYCQDSNNTFSASDMLQDFGAVIRRIDYSGPEWQIVLPGQTRNPYFDSYIENQCVLLQNEYNKILDSDKKVYLNNVINSVQKDIVDWKHMIASALGYMYSSVVPAYWFSWGGDLATFAKDIHLYIGTNKKEYAISIFANSNEQGAGSFSYQDLVADVDAIELAQLFTNFSTTSPYHVLSNALYYYYHNCVSHRKQNLLLDIPDNQTLDVTVSALTTKLLHALNKDHPLVNWFETIVGYTFPMDISVYAILGGDARTDQEAATIACEVMAKYIISETNDLYGES